MDNINNIHDTPTTATAATATANYALNGKIMLCSVVVLFGVVSAVIFFHAYARCCSDRRRNRLPNFHRNVVLDGTRQPTGVNVADALRAANRARQFAGLDPSLLKTLPTFVYGGTAASAPPPECAVCLSEFEDGERGRTLPACGHAFHAACIDAWFGSHSSCPLCRSPVKPTEPAAPGSSADSHVEIAVSEPTGESEPTQDRDRVEPGSGFRAEWSDRKPQDLAGLALRDDQITGSGLGSTERNRVKYSLKRIWSI